MFKISSSKLERTSYALNQVLIDEIPQISFIGRSNVGKSSLMNYILNNKLAKISSTPGKTRSINYYLVNDKYRFVDLPGYGFARISKNEREHWDNLLKYYFDNTVNLEMIFLLMDSRHPLLDNDIKMIEWVLNYGYPMSIILTKSDKLNNSQINATVSSVKTAIQPYGDFMIFPVSSSKRKGIQNLLDFLEVLF